MKSNLNSLFDMLAYLLRGLNTDETKLMNDLGVNTDQITSTLVRCEVDDYLGGLRDNLLGIERIFSYLMTNNVTRKDHVVQELIRELNELFLTTDQSYLKDIFIISALRGISAYKTSLYHTAYQITLELDLETPADILQEILEREKKSFESFERLTLTQFTNV